MKNKRDFLKEYKSVVGEYLFYQLLIFIFMKLYVFKDFVLKPFGILIFTTQMVFLWCALVIAILLFYLCVRYRNCAKFNQWKNDAMRISILPMLCVISIRYFAISGLVFGIDCILLIFFVIIFIINREKLKRTEKRYQKYRVYFWNRVFRISFFAGAVIGLAVFAESLQIGKSVNWLMTEQKIILDEASLNIDWQNIYQCLTEETWCAMNAGEKICVLQDIIDYEASVMLGCNRVKIEMALLQKNVNGCYIHDSLTNDIYLSEEHLKNSSAKEVLTTALHELYHCYEYFCMSDMEKNSDVLYLKKIKKWKENTEHYFTIEENRYEAYREQPLEADAYNYSEKRAAEIMENVE